VVDMVPGYCKKGQAGRAIPVEGSQGELALGTVQDGTVPVGALRIRKELDAYEDHA